MFFIISIGSSEVLTMTEWPSKWPSNWPRFEDLSRVRATLCQPPCSCPQGLEVRTLPHLQAKGVFQDKMQKCVDLFFDLSGDSYLKCNLCSNYHCWHHCIYHKHFHTLWNIVEPMQNEPYQEVRCLPCFQRTVCLRKLTIRFNHLDGAIDVWLGRAEQPVLRFSDFGQIAPCGFVLSPPLRLSQSPWTPSCLSPRTSVELVTRSSSSSHDLRDRSMSTRDAATLSGQVSGDSTLVFPRDVSSHGRAISYEISWEQELSLNSSNVETLDYAFEQLRARVISSLRRGSCIKVQFGLREATDHPTVPIATAASAAAAATNDSVSPAVVSFVSSDSRQSFSDTSLDESLASFPLRENLPYGRLPPRNTQILTLSTLNLHQRLDEVTDKKRFLLGLLNLEIDARFYGSWYPGTIYEIVSSDVVKVLWTDGTATDTHLSDIRCKSDI